MRRVDLGPFADELIRTDHALDAFVSAIVARAAELGRVHDVPDALAEAAATEGWIHLPSVSSPALVAQT